MKSQEEKIKFDTICAIIEKNIQVWYNGRGMAAFYTEAIEPRPEFAAQRRQTPTEVSLWYNRRGMTGI